MELLNILIQKDPATRIAKQASQEQAAEYAKDFDVFVVNEDGSVSPFEAAVAVEETPAAEEPKAAKKAAK